MRAFITGASGYIGGSVAARFVKAGHQVIGLVRNRQSMKPLESAGITPVLGDLGDEAILTREAAAADVIVNAASADNRRAAEVILDALYGSQKVYIHTSGSSIVSDEANGEFSGRTFDEDSPLTPPAEKKERVALDRFVLDAAKKGVHSAVICPCLIYGDGLGLRKDSIQIPLLIAQARKNSIARCIGRGRNIWSTVHIADLADLYLLAAEKPVPAGTFMFAENGEISFRQIAESIRESLGLSAPIEEWPIEQAVKEWGREAAVFALGSNSRIRARRARSLGWNPQRDDVEDYIAAACGRLVATAR